MNKTIIKIAVGVVLVGGIAFYGGAKYGGSAAAQSGGFSNFAVTGRQAGFRGTGGAEGGARGGGGFVTGEILSKDDQSITVKLQDGGSKIVFISASTTVSKSAPAGAVDLTVGEQVVAAGVANQDGSVSARTIQIGGASRGFTFPN